MKILKRVCNFYRAMEKLAAYEDTRASGKRTPEPEQLYRKNFNKRA